MKNCYRWHKPWAFYLVWLVHFLFITPALSQEYLVSVQHYSLPEGLSHRYVRHVAQDKRGFIWAATYDGINRFDGFEFRKYTEEKDGLSSTSCHKILEDRRGQMWLFYTIPPTKEVKPRGFFFVDLFDPATGLATPFEKAFQAPFAVKDITEVQPGNLGNIYFLLRSGEIYRYDGFAFRCLLHIPFAGSGFLSISDEGLIALLNGDSVIQLDSLGNVLYRTPLPAVCDFIRVAKGRFWVGENTPTSISTMWSIRAGQPAQPVYFRGSDGRPTNFAWDKNYGTPVYPDRLGRWWVFFKGQLFLFDPNGKFLYDFSAGLKPFTLPHPPFIYFDRRNTAWISSSQGLRSVSIQKNPFDNYLQSDDLIDTRGIVEDKQGRVYVLQQGHTWRLDKDSGAAVNLGIPAWTAAARDAGGALWFGDYGFKVHFYDPVSGEKKIYYPSGPMDEDQANSTHALFPDAASGRLWIGTNGRGLAYLDPQDERISLFTAYQQFQHLGKANIKSFLKDERGLWLGTNLGLYLLDPVKGITAEYSRRTGSLPFDDISHIHKDKEGFFWLATKQGGLIRWDRDAGNFRQFTQRDGLSNEVIHAVYEDEYGQLWLPSNYGLMRFDKHTFQVNTYLPRDGLPHEEFNYCSHYQAADGRLYFGGLKGVAAFYPATLSRETQQASPRLGISQYLELDGATGALVDKTAKLLAANEIRLAPRNKSFILKIAFPDYQSPQDNRFAYRIDGLYQNWVYQSDNTIQINGLPYGSFTLHVKAQGASGRWSANELRLPLLVLRPFYLRTWFLAACLALALFLIWWRIRIFKQAALRLENEVKKRTIKIEQGKQLIEKQAIELRELDKLKSRFFANMAHELRTPLTLILGPLKKVLSYPGLDKHLLPSLKLARKNAKSLFRLAEEILDMDKLEARQLALQEETLAFQPLMRRLVSNFESHAQANGVLLQFFFEASEDLYLRLDFKKLERILFNLLSNALKFTGRGGKVSVTVRETADRICILVADTGRGIHPDDLPHIFDRFYQAKHQSGQAEGGAGIGLALAYEYARLLEGTLTAQSQLNEGSTFVLEFPKKETPELDLAASVEMGPMSLLAPADRLPTIPVASREINEEQDQGAASAKVAKEAVILLAEDNSDMRFFLQDILSPPYRVLATSNGAHALQQLESLAPGHLPELIITDIMMPEMDGFTLIQRLKSSPEWQGIPIIALTARVGLDDRLAALRIGVDDYLTKPFEPAELLARISNLLHNYRRRREQAAVEGTDQSPEIITADQQWLAELETIALDNIARPDFSVDELAHQLFLSGRHLRRKLKKLTGLPPTEYLKEIRLQRARQLLDNRTCRNVAEVSYTVGISTPRYFARLFKTRFGRNPSSYF